MGTGGEFQTPSLIATLDRAPYFHDGCALELDEALSGGCASEAHDVPADRLEDLVAYLSSL